MRVASLLAMVVVLSTGALAGCIGSEADESLAGSAADGIVPRPVPVPLSDPVTLVTDVVGDASLKNTGLVRDEVACTQQLVGGLCDALEPTPRAGLPAEGAVDIVGVSIAENHTTIAFILELASVPDDLAAVVPSDSEALWWEVCWAEHGIASSSCSGWRWGARVQFAVARGAAPGKYVSAVTRSYDDADGTPCNDWAWCETAVPVAVTAGSPGSITWYVPRSLLPETMVPDATLKGVGGRVWNQDWIGPTSVVAGHGAAEPVFGRTAVPASNFADVTEVADHVFAMAPAATSFRWDGPVPIRGWSYPDTPDDLVVTALDLVETPTTLTLATRLARVEPSDLDIHFEFELGLPSGRIFTVDYHPNRVADHVDWAGMCSDASCERWIEAHPRVEQVAGSPGWINITIERHELASPRAGERLTLVDIELYAWTGSTGIGDERVGLAFRDVEWTGWIGPHFVFAMDSAAHPVSTTAIEDDVDDVADLPFGGPRELWRPAQFDITYVGVKPLAMDMSLVTLGVRDLSSISVPLGYDAVFYSVAAQVEPTPMLVGYYRERDAERGEFFCAEDTLTYGAAHTMPAREFWQIIDGVISMTQDEGQDRARGGGGGTTMTFRIPGACFGSAEGTTVTAAGLTAAAYAVQQVPGGEAQLTQLDDVGAEGVYPMTAAPPAPPPAAWYAAPFGVSDFWDILGAALAVGLALGTALFVLRRRRAMRRYLREMTGLAASHASDPDALARSLVALRDRLHDDFVHHRISESHFPIVQDRLRSRLTSARINSISESYYSLPPAVAMRIERLLGDGTLSREDHASLLPIVSRTRMPERTRRALVGRLQQWVSEDAHASI